ncbi:hypothetical protein FJY71_00350 [candidate division WOR-3 bacterium]|nr:hypothetical protein [candidate division WOR-3 bacterium]
MKTRLTTALALVAALYCLAWAAGEEADSQQPAAISIGPSQTTAETDAITIPRMLSYQGKLTDTFGLPVVDTTYSISFRLYIVPTGGTPFWNETQTVRTRGGLFSTLLGSVAPIGSMPDAGGAYVAMAVNGGAELAPRLRIASAAYAYKADTAAFAVAGGDAQWVQGADTVLYTAARVGLARGGAGNGLLGNRTITHTNFGAEACTTGQGGQNLEFCTIGGGKNNKAVGNLATVGGGLANTANEVCGTVAGGNDNTAGDHATVGGGVCNSASGWLSSVVGGQRNAADGAAAAIGGGGWNRASGSFDVVAGGMHDTASGGYSVVSGGRYNSASSGHSAVGGGMYNRASGYAGTVGGGYANLASDSCAVVGGGFADSATSLYATVGGGFHNVAEDTCAVVGGGNQNIASGFGATVPGGSGNAAWTRNSFAANGLSTVGGANSNSAAFNSATATASGQLRCGTLSKGGGSFTIDHPLDPYGKILNHYFIEGPEMRNLYDGEAVLDASGRAVITLPDYFSTLNRNPRVQLTGLGTSDVYVTEEVVSNRLVIGGKPGTKVYWQVTGERKDVTAEAIRRMMPVEQPKTQDLAGRMLDDDFLVGCMEQLAREGKAQGIDFRTAAGRMRYEQMKQMTAEQQEAR